MRLIAIFTGAADALTTTRLMRTGLRGVSTVASCRRAFRRLLLATTVAVIATPVARAATPDSPEVKQMVARGVKYIEGTKAISSSFGGASLRALALVKGEASLEHRLIKHAIDATRLGIKQAKSSKLKETIIYEMATATIFLCELDAEQFKPEIETMMKMIMSWQKAAGGWGYLEGAHRETCDISQTQYAVLAMWTADRTGAYKLDVKAAEKAANYLMRVQDPSGGFGYQGVDPGIGKFSRQKQVHVQNSLTAAGTGSVYICADLLRLSKGSFVEKRRQSNIPAALRAVSTGSKTALGPLSREVDRTRINKSMIDGAGWLSRTYQVAPEEWPSYYMYAYERFQSFRELAEAIDEDSPKWYNDTVDFLKQTQKETGAWSFDFEYDTSFAILFLTRGTKKSIMKAEGFGGRLRGGRGLPSDTANVMVGEDGTIVKTAFQGQAESLLAMLEAQGDTDFDASNQELDIKLSTDPVKREEQLQRLRRLLAAEEFNIRYAAIKVLAADNDLDNVPALIFALDDPDRRVVIRARDALRGLSRKFEGFGLSDNPTDAEKVSAVQRWKEWYQLIRPSARFLK